MHGAVKALLARPAGMALAFATHVVLARLMGADEYGIFIYVYVWTYFLGLLARLGLDRSAVRFGTAFADAGDFASFGALARVSFGVACALGVVGALVLALVVIAWPAPLSPGLRDCFLAGCFAIPLLAVHNVFEGLAQARKRIWQATVPEQVLRQPLLGVAAVGAYEVCGGVLTATDATLAYLAALGVTLAIDYGWYRWTNTAGGALAPGRVRREWLSYAAQMSVTHNLGTWIQQADVILVGALLGVQAASLYSVASRVGGLAAWVGLTAIVVFGPLAAGLVAENDRGKLQRHVSLVARAMAPATLAIALILWLLRDPILGLFGPEFTAAAAAFTILLVGYVVRDFFGPAFITLSMTRHHGVTTSVLAGCATLNLALNLTWIPSVGPEGAAMATAVTVVAYSAWFWWLCRERLGIETTPFPRRDA